MRHESLTDDGWFKTVETFGGVAHLEAEARRCGAFERGRKITCAVDLLRLVLAYCLGSKGLRLTAAWAEAIGLASMSNVAVLKRLRKAAPWLEAIVARLIGERSARRTVDAAKGRLIRIVDATVVAKASLKDRQAGGVWRVHAVFDLDGTSERFSAFDLTDEREGERLDRAAVVAGEIRIADRAYLQPDRIARVRAAGADILIRAPWNGARWLDAGGKPLNLIAKLMKARRAGFIDRPIGIAVTGDEPIRLRLVAIRKPEEAIVATRAKLEAEARAKGRHLKPETLVAAAWVILVTSLDGRAFSTAEIGELYKIRWRIEIAFKHLKSGLGFHRPLNEDPGVAKAHVLSHLILALLTEPLVEEHLGVSPHLAAA